MDILERANEYLKALLFHYLVFWSCFRTFWSQILACCNFGYTVPDLQPSAHCTRITLLHAHMHVLTNPLSQVSRHPFTQTHTHKRMRRPLSCRKAARRDSSPVMLLAFCRTRFFFFSFSFFLINFQLEVITASGDEGFTATVGSATAFSVEDFEGRRNNRFSDEEMGVFTIPEGRMS